MVMNDTLAGALSKINQYEKLGKGECIVNPASKTISSVLSILKKFGYIKGYNKIKEGRKESINVKLTGKINKCGAIKPRYSVKRDDYERFEKRYLPAKGMGIMIVTTVNGIVEHKKAEDKKIGGKLIAYCY